MSFIYNYSLKSHNTFGIDVFAKEFVAIQDIKTFREVCAGLSKQELFMILGGGSNILFTGDFYGKVIKNEIGGIILIKEDQNHFFLQVGAGVIWHDLVMHCVANNFQGIENLALIPGCVGAAPMQNIGAYGVELKDIFHELSAIEIESGDLVKFNLAQCKFGYRESIFKNEFKNKFVIVSVTFKLNKKPLYNISYGNIREMIDKNGEPELNMYTIANTVINVRKSKLPDPKEIGNAGSFFKNPEISLELFNELKINFPAIVGYKTDDG